MDRGRLTTASSERALLVACRTASLDSAGSTLIRLGENALYVLPSEGLVARISRSVDLADRVNRELLVARWLADLDFPATRVAERVVQPLVANGRLVTFWLLEDLDPSQTATTRDLGRVLRDLHSLPVPPFELPVFNPFSAVPLRLANPGEADPQDVEYLAGLHAALRIDYRGLQLPGSLGFIHGDAHRGNLLVSSGRVLISDFEVVGRGPREWDLVPTAIAAERFGLSVSHYLEFTEAYGRDVTKWSGYPTLRAIRELTMTTWLMQNIAEDPAIAAEFRIRVASLQEGDYGRTWRAF